MLESFVVSAMKFEKMLILTILFLCFILHSHSFTFQLPSLPFKTSRRYASSYLKPTTTTTTSLFASDIQNEQRIKYTKVFIGNLPFTVTKEEIAEMIEANIGPDIITAIDIPVGKKSKAPRGFAFVEFVDEEAAIEAASILNDMMIDDRPLNSNIYDENPDIKKRKKTRVNAHTVFVNNLETSLIQEEILSMCDDILGPDLVVSLQLPVDKVTKNTRGMAYIEFVDAAAAELAIKELNGLDVLGKVLTCLPFQPKKVDKERPTDDDSSNNNSNNKKVQQ
jgi:RNA recognition motif-containing protein